ncbi:hypothetical protein IKE67_00895 [bacterium]|nr:hypothetical protein [bacterium]
MLTKEQENLITQIDSAFEEIMSIIDFMENLNKENFLKVQKIIDIAEQGYIFTEELKIKISNK